MPLSSISSPHFFFLDYLKVQDMKYYDKHLLLYPSWSLGTLVFPIWWYHWRIFCIIVDLKYHYLFGIFIYWYFFLLYQFKIALCQLSVTADKEKNIARARKAIEEAADKGAKLVVLPVSNLISTVVNCSRLLLRFSISAAWFTFWCWMMMGLQLNGKTIWNWCILFKK